MRKPAKRLPIEEKVRVVLAVLGGEMTASEAARRHGVSVQAVLTWRNRFLDAGQQALGDKIPGPGKSAGSADERRLKLENNQLKLALAEATVQLRICRRALSTPRRSLRRPRGPKSGSGSAGLEVRPPGGHSAAQLLPSPRSAA